MKKRKKKKSTTRKKHVIGQFTKVFSCVLHIRQPRWHQKSRKQKS